METLLTLTEAVEAIPVSEATLRRAIKAGKIEYTTNEKGRRLFDPAELDRIWGKTGEETPFSDAQAESSANETEPSGIEKAKPVTPSGIEKAKPVTSLTEPSGIEKAKPVTPVSPYDQCDLLRLRRIRERYDIALEGVSLDDEGEPTSVDVIDTFFYIEDAVEEWVALTKGAHWIDTYDRDDAMLHDAAQYERVNLRRYDAVSVIRRGYKHSVGAVKLDDLGRIQRRYVYYQFDSQEGALAFAKKLTGKCEIQVINS